jgi:metallo-beta-lactamase family protein
MATLRFLGAAGTVTGSRFLLEHEGKKVLFDCGLFQGLKELRLRNWEPFPVTPSSIDAVVLTHAHIDHTGGLPGLVKQGFKGPVFSTPATRSLVGLLLPDSAHLQEEEARDANRHRYSKHSPALPLYGVADAHEALKLFETFGYARPKEILPGIQLTFARAGHILGSAVCIVDLLSTKQRVVFSGDLGRYHAPILKDPERVPFATTLVAESTYGDREHGDHDPMESLAQAVKEAVARRGVMVIPAFAVGRTQEILYYLRQLESEKRIPTLDVFVDSPMACDATPFYLAHEEEHDLTMRSLLDRGIRPLEPGRTRFVNAVEESKKLRGFDGPGIIISASGMATGGRVLHHLKQRLPSDRNTILFVGYQAVGTRGRRMLDGEKEIRIHGENIPVNAVLKTISGFSAHADWREMLRWMEGFEHPPRQTLLVHGEPKALSALAERVKKKGWPVHIPAHGETVPLAAP